MQGKYKQFDQQLFNQEDARARARVIDYITDVSGQFVVANDDKYGPDLVLYRGFQPVAYIEVETKRVWRSIHEHFPWPTVQIPERKGKFLGLNYPIEFWILRQDLEMAVVVPESAFENALMAEVPNIYQKEGELFWQIPIEYCSLVSLANPGSSMMDSSSDEDFQLV